MKQLRPAFADAWFSDEFTHEAGILTNALQSSFSGNSSNGDVCPTEVVESLCSEPAANEIAVLKRRLGGVPPSGKVSKRKSRVAKRSAATTFICADPENFRHMVQQVTGGRLHGLDEPLAAAQVLERDRIKGVNWEGGSLTLDTSAFLLDRSAATQFFLPSSASDGGGSVPAGRLLDSVCSFPTLESWEAL